MASIYKRQTVLYQEEHLYQNYTANLTAFNSVMLVLIVIAVALRFASRRRMCEYLGRDDWTFLGGSVLTFAGIITMIIYSADAGLGEHWIALTPKQKHTFSRLNYAFNIFNLSCYPIVKISILLLYIRIFYIFKRFRNVMWVAVGALSCIAIANTLTTIFSCSPVRGFWDTSVPSKCIDDVKFYWATAILNIITDVFLITAPIPVLWKRNIRHKWAIIGLFMLGGLTLIISILRIIYYLQYTNTDPSYSFLNTAYATPAEITLAVVVASAPTWTPYWLSAISQAHSVYYHLRSYKNRSGSSDGSDFPNKHLSPKTSDDKVPQVRQVREIKGQDDSLLVPTVQTTEINGQTTDTTTSMTTNVTSDATNSATNNSTTVSKTDDVV